MLAEISVSPPKEPMVKRAALALAPAIAVVLNVLLFYFYVSQYSVGGF